MISSKITIVEATDNVFACLAGEATQDSEYSELKLAPSGLIDQSDECSGDIGYLRRITASIREIIDPCAWIAIKDHEVVGILLYAAPPTAHNEIILTGCVAPDHQNIGHGIRLYQRGIDIIEATTSFSGLIVQIYDRNKRSQRVHRFLGFRPYETGYDNELGDFTWYRRALKSAEGR